MGNSVPHLPTHSFLPPRKLPVPYICSVIRKWPKGLHPSLKSNSFLFPFRMAHNYWSELPPPPPASRLPPPAAVSAASTEIHFYSPIPPPPPPPPSVRYVLRLCLEKRVEFCPRRILYVRRFFFASSAFFLKYISVGEKRGRR